MLTFDPTGKGSIAPGQTPNLQTSVPEGRCPVSSRLFAFDGRPFSPSLPLPTLFLRAADLWGRAVGEALGLAEGVERWPSLGTLGGRRGEEGGEGGEGERGGIAQEGAPAMSPKVMVGCEEGARGDRGSEEELVGGARQN